MATATFGMGCFWAAEEVMARVPGVTATEAGFSNGDDAGASAADVFSGARGHAEVVRVDYDPDRVGFDELLAVFWANHDATVTKPIVRSAIFVHDEAQRAAAEASRAAQPGAVATEIAAAGRFWRAPEKDQRYLARRRAAEAAE